MCGIVGVVSDEITPQTKNRFQFAFDALFHRGPHGSKILSYSFGNNSKDNLIFGHHRLAIVDLNERANQPLTSTKGSVLIINGEIYNASELRELLKKQYAFKTSSDSEVALAVLEVYGITGISKLDGMFALAFYPAGESSVWIARDRLGIKPLYLAKSGDDIWFSSEAKPLARALNKKLDDIGISEWVQYQLQVTNRTFFMDITSVPPGYLLTIKDGVVKSRQYWNMEDHLSSNQNFKIKPDDAIHQLKYLLTESVSKHLMSDVEVATITSGGVDSSTISAIAAKFGVKQAFMGRYNLENFDESIFALEVAKHSGLALNITDISESDFFNTLPMVAAVLDFPTAGPGSVGQYLVAKSISRTHRVVLAGTGGDELLLGYTRDRFPLWAKNSEIKSLDISSITPPEFSIGYDALFSKFVNANGLFSPVAGFLATITRSATSNPLFSISKHRQEAIYSELRAHISPTGGESLIEIHDSLLRFEVAKFLPSLLHVEDRMTMAHGLEARVPLLDLNLVEFILSLPQEVRMLGASPKDLLKRSVANYLPKKILNRKDKMGFPVPLINWANTTSQKRVNSILVSLSEREIPGVSIRMHSDKKLLSELDARELWAGLIFESWLRSLY